MLIEAVARLEKAPTIISASVLFFLLDIIYLRSGLNSDLSLI